MKKNKNICRSPGYTKPSVQSAITCGGYAGFQPHPKPCLEFLAAKYEESLSVRVSATPIFPAIRWRRTAVATPAPRALSLTYLVCRIFCFWNAFFLNFFYFFASKRSSCEINHRSFLSLLLHFLIYISYIAW